MFTLLANSLCEPLRGGNTSTNSLTALIDLYQLLQAVAEC